MVDIPGINNNNFLPQVGVDNNSSDIKEGVSSAANRGSLAPMSTSAMAIDPVNRGLSRAVITGNGVSFTRNDFEVVALNSIVENNDIPANYDTKYWYFGGMAWPTAALADAPAIRESGQSLVYPAGYVTAGVGVADTDPTAVFDYADAVGNNQIDQLVFPYDQLPTILDVRCKVDDSYYVNYKVAQFTKTSLDTTVSVGAVETQYNPDDFDATYYTVDLSGAAPELNHLDDSSAEVVSLGSATTEFVLYAQINGAGPELGVASYPTLDDVYKDMGGTTGSTVMTDALIKSLNGDVLPSSVTWILKARTTHTELVLTDGETYDEVVVETDTNKAVSWVTTHGEKQTLPVDAPQLSSKTFYDNLSGTTTMRFTVEDLGNKQLFIGSTPIGDPVPNKFLRYEVHVPVGQTSNITYTDNKGNKVVLKDSDIDHVENGKNVYYISGDNVPTDNVDIYAPFCAGIEVYLVTMGDENATDPLVLNPTSTPIEMPTVINYRVLENIYQELIPAIDRSNVLVELSGIDSDLNVIDLDGLIAKNDFNQVELNRSNGRVYKIISYEGALAPTVADDELAIREGCTLIELKEAIAEKEGISVDEVRFNSEDIIYGSGRLSWNIDTTFGNLSRLFAGDATETEVISFLEKLGLDTKAYTNNGQFDTKLVADFMYEFGKMLSPWFRHNAVQAETDVQLEIDKAKGSVRMALRADTGINSDIITFELRDNNQLIISTGFGAQIDLPMLVKDEDDATLPPNYLDFGLNATNALTWAAPWGNLSIFGDWKAYNHGLTNLWLFQQKYGLGVEVNEFTGELSYSNLAVQRNEVEGSSLKTYQNKFSVAAGINDFNGFDVGLNYVLELDNLLDTSSHLAGLDFGYQYRFDNSVLSSIGAKTSWTLDVNPKDGNNLTGNLAIPIALNDGTLSFTPYGGFSSWGNNKSYAYNVGLKVNLGLFDIDVMTEQQKNGNFKLGIAGGVSY